MKERPILFSAPMVRAILEGKKTQTRRIVKSPAKNMQAAGMQVIKYRAPGDPWYKDCVWSMRGPSGVWGDYTHERFMGMCPYGRPGDHLWVKETHGPSAGGLVYRADESVACPDGGKWRPSIHMPRWASRITLEITGVRVERAQDISVSDIAAEGLDVAPTCQPNVSPESWEAMARQKWGALWSSINGPDSWAANPWVWVIEFRRVAP